jgi:hypothetical protein
MSVPVVSPRTSLAGLVVVVPAFLLLAFGFGGPQRTLEVLGAFTTFALPVIAMIAFWWQDWPGSRLRPGWSGLTDTLVVVVAAFVPAAIGQAVAGEAGAIPLAAAVFTVFLQLTLVSEGWPLRGRGVLWPGLVALVICWIIGAAAYLAFDATGAEHTYFGSWLTAAGVWQLVFFVALRGWPFTGIINRGIRLLAGNAVVVAAAFATHVVMLDLFKLDPDRVTAICGAGIAAVLVVAMLFEPLESRLWTVVVAVVVTAGLYLLLATSGSDHWAAYAAMNALGVAVILHVAVWRRWPVGKGET